MKILLASGEVHPYSKTGGLGDMVAALAKALAREGHQVGLVTPLYAGIRERFPALKPFDWVLNLPLGGRRIQGIIWTLEPVPGLTIYFIDQPEFYLRPGLYQNGGFDYHDNAERFIFLSKTVVHLARHLPWQPEFIHVHDWHVGLVPLLMQHEKSLGWSNAPRTCLTIHNLAYQGQFPVTKFPLTNLPWSYFKPEGAEFYGQLNALKAGIFFADAVSTGPAGVLAGAAQLKPGGRFGGGLYLPDAQAAFSCEAGVVAVDAWCKLDHLPEKGYATLISMADAHRLVGLLDYRRTQRQAAPGCDRPALAGFIDRGRNRLRALGKNS